MGYRFARFCPFRPIGLKGRNEFEQCQCSALPLSYAPDRRQIFTAF